VAGCEEDGACQVRGVAGRLPLPNSIPLNPIFVAI